MKHDFLAYATQYYSRRLDSGEISFHTWNNSLSHLRCFAAFLREGRPSPPALEEITEPLLQAYRQDCLRKGNRIPTVNQKLLPVALTFRHARQEGLIGANRAAALSQPYLSARKGPYGGFLPEDGGAPVRYLTDAQLARLVTLHETLPPGNRRNVLELFLFSFHACGLRASDVITLEWKHIDFEEALLRKTMVKTRARLEIPLSGPALDILDRWKRRGLNNRFVFNQLSADFDFRNRGALERAVDSRNRQLRRVLNEIGRELGFPFPLGMHTARHTFAVKALNAARTDVHLISRLLGHSSVTVTEKVYATFLLPTLSGAVRERLCFQEYGLPAVPEAGK